MNESSAPSSNYDLAYGSAGIVVAAICFGVCYAPVKKVSTGDGMFFQWLMCCAIGLVGICTQIFVGNGDFYPLGLLGGALWATGNVCAVPVFKTIGMSLGILIWSMFNMLFGWASGRFGWFGIKPNIPGNESMNYAGVVIALSRGIFLAIFAGMNFGLTFIPSIYIQDNYSNASKTGVSYVMANYLGIFLASSFYFVIYAICKRGRNLVPNSQMILPSFLSGILWSIATLGWFVANAVLSVTITFPIVTTIPCVIASTIGIVVFREIRGLRNYILLGAAAVLTIVGVILTALSR